MTAKLLSRRQRVLRVRQSQHLLAVTETVRARDEANSIASNAERLARVRAELFTAEPQMGGTFAAYRELADRLERAGKRLEGALYDAEKVIDEKRGLEVAANREKEIAQRLMERAHERLEEQREARLAAIPRYRQMQSRGQQ
ncbi:MAG: hypothetical protein AB7U35_08070 [Sphingobium sp.]